MANIDQMPEYRANLPRHTHDLSHDFGFTCSTAHLLPVFHDFLNAGETVELGFNYFLRTQPLQSAAMSKLTTHVEYFFVPMNLLFQPFGSYYYGVSDEYSSNFGDLQLDGFPIVEMDDVFDAINHYGDDRSLYSANGVMVGENLRSLGFRLADHFGFDPYGIIRDRTLPVREDSVPNVFPYQYLAYNCIYQYYYRLDNRESFDNTTFNFDKFYTQSFPMDTAVITNWKKIFTLKYRPLGSDYFSDVKVSPIVDVLNLNNKDSLAAAHNWLTRNEFTGTLGTFSVIGSGSTGSRTTQTTGDVGANSISSPGSSIQTQFGFNSSNVSGAAKPNGMDINTANIRAMFASEKLWSITGRAKKHYDDQTLAHFGFRVPHDPKHEISIFGHDKGSISIGEVISTSNTYNADTESGSPLAEIAGKGYGSLQGKSHKFTAPCHGVVMAIFSVVADRNYYEGFPKYNVMTDLYDLYQPEYDHLGMQPMFFYETGDYVQEERSQIFGWQYRYEQWKRRYNRVTSAFADRFGIGAPFASWMNISRANLTHSSNAANTASFVPFVNLPSDINDLMLLGYKMNWSGTNSLYLNDPFIVSGHVNCKKVSTMSDYSLPRLDA